MNYLSSLNTVTLGDLKISEQILSTLQLSSNIIDMNSQLSVTSSEISDLKTISASQNTRITNLENSLSQLSLDREDDDIQKLYDTVGAIISTLGGTYIR